MPPGVALILDIETDGKARSLEDIKVVIRRHKGRPGPGAMSFFTRLGRVVFASQPDAEAGAEVTPPITVDEVLDDAIEAGAEDIEADDEGNIVMWTQPNMTSALTKALGPRFGGRVLSSEIIWKVNDETRARVEKPSEAVALADLLDAVSEFPEVQAVYANVADGGVPEEVWSRIEESLDG
jgi:transcriptional/translational regulatory protein YebC/TACO1